MPLENGLWDADARAELEDVAEIDPRLAEVEEAVDTLGGLAFVLAEQVPPVGVMLSHDSGWRIEVTAGNERRVSRLRLHPPSDEPAKSELWPTAACPPCARLKLLFASSALVRPRPRRRAWPVAFGPVPPGRALEDFTGKRLFTRQHQAMKLTDDGQAFLRCGLARAGRTGPGG